jgi:hypothetical protein
MAAMISGLPWILKRMSSAIFVDNIAAGNQAVGLICSRIRETSADSPGAGSAGRDSGVTLTSSEPSSDRGLLDVEGIFTLVVCMEVEAILRRQRVTHRRVGFTYLPTEPDCTPFTTDVSHQPQRAPFATSSLCDLTRPTPNVQHLLTDIQICAV